LYAKILQLWLSNIPIADEYPEKYGIRLICLDSGAKKILLPTISFNDFSTVPPELMGAFQLIPYKSVEDAVFKALGVE